MSRNFDVEPSDLEVYLGDTAMFQCEISSVPSATISWYKDNQLLKDRISKYRTYPEGVLEIYNVEFRDFGNYYCAVGDDERPKSRVTRLSQKKAGVYKIVVMLKCLNQKTRDGLEVKTLKWSDINCL